MRQYHIVCYDSRFISKSTKQWQFHLKDLVQKNICSIHLDPLGNHIVWFSLSFSRLASNCSTSLSWSRAYLKFPPADYIYAHFLGPFQEVLPHQWAPSYPCLITLFSPLDSCFNTVNIKIRKTYPVSFRMGFFRWILTYGYGEENT